LRIKAFALPFICVLAMLLSVPLAGAPAPSYAAFFAFGDSLADVGNDYLASPQIGIEPAVPPSIAPHKLYWKGRFSNGPVAFEYLWKRIALPGRRGTLEPSLAVPVLNTASAVNFAFGGSGSGVAGIPGGPPVPGLIAQVQSFQIALGGRPIAPNTLAAIVTGAGDYFAHVVAPESPELIYPDQVVANIAFAVESLYFMGVRDAMVLNLPDLGQIPLTANTPAAGYMTWLSNSHNTLLAAAMAQLRAEHPDFTIRMVDVNTVLAQLPASTNRMLPAVDALLPAAPGELPMSLCLFTNPLNCRNAPTFDVGLDFLFWDVEHPTTAVHELLANHLYRSLTP
jgi:phospholipase/lecithinase/hemolysin